MTDKFYLSTPWKQARAQQLAIHPTCQHMNCGRKATNVDHRVPRRFGGASLHPSNLWSLCPSCHSSKTARRDGGFGNARSDRAMRPPRGCDADGYPLAWK